MDTLPTEKKPAEKTRALALDALRGVAIILMCLSGRVPFDARYALPDWMYHAQGYHPRFGVDANVMGFTWVDLVFPMFLFSMGVAFPLALYRRVDAGESKWKIIASAGGRALGLIGFAIYFNAVNPYSMGNIKPDIWKWTLAFAGFLLLFPVFMRFSDKISTGVRWALKLGGIAAAVGIMYYIGVQQGRAKPINLYNSNIILILLAEGAFFGTIIWLFTRTRHDLRIMVLAALSLMLLSTTKAGNPITPIVMPNLYNFMPESLANFIQTKSPVTDFKWMYNFGHLKYLTIVIIGTIIGDNLLAWMKQGTPGIESAPRRKFHDLVAAIALVVVIYAHIVLQLDWKYASLLGIPAGAILVYKLIGKVEGPAEAFLRSLLGWGAVWITLGMLIEPFDGGVKKTPPPPGLSFSYYFVSAGLSILCLYILTVLIDICKRPMFFTMTVKNGQNPMLAYLGINNFMEPVYFFVGLAALQTFLLRGGSGAFIDSTIGIPLFLMFVAVFKTVLLAWLVAVCTRYKLIWRA